MGGLATVQIECVQEGDPNPSLLGRGEQRCAHRIGIVVRRAIDLMVQVVELPDDHNSGEGHFGEDCLRQSMVARGI